MVCTPTYWVTIPILDDGTGPSEPCADVVCVSAVNRRRAKVEGVRSLRQLYPDGYLTDVECPFTGLVVEEMIPCDHGKYLCCEECSNCEHNYLYR